MSVLKERRAVLLQVTNNVKIKDFNLVGRYALSTAV
jgi:DUF971 family protein